MPVALLFSLNQLDSVRVKSKLTLSQAWYIPSKNLPPQIETNCLLRPFGHKATRPKAIIGHLFLLLEYFAPATPLQKVLDQPLLTAMLLVFW